MFKVGCRNKAFARHCFRETLSQCHCPYLHPPLGASGSRSPHCISLDSWRSLGLSCHLVLLSYTAQKSFPKCFWLLAFGSPPPEMWSSVILPEMLFLVCACRMSTHHLGCILGALFLGAHVAQSSVVMSVGSVVRDLGSVLPLLLTLAVWSWPAYCTSLSLSFLTCKMGFTDVVICMQSSVSA